MKNKDVIALQHCGVQLITAHTLPANQAYRVYRFKKSIDEAYTAIGKREEELIKDAGISDVEQARKRYAELQKKEDRNEGEQKEFDEIAGKHRAAQNLIAELHDDDTPIDCKSVPYDAWVALQRENNRVRHPAAEDKTIDILSGYAERILENVLWVAPPDDNDDNLK